MDKKIKSEELSKHKTKSSLWILYNKKVYDVTTYLADHPGGDNVFVEHAGKDCTKAFDDAGHTDWALKHMEKYLIGIIE